MTNIKPTHTTAPMLITVSKTERISPHFQRVTFTSDDLTDLVWKGNDQWVRLFFPADDESTFDYVPEKLTMGTYLKMLTVSSRKRPVIRSYTLRNLRPEVHELDIDFVVHGDEGVAGPWAQRAVAGDTLMMLDQGCGWPGSPGAVVIAADESALPAALGVVRDMPTTATGVVLIEIPDADDAQDVDVPGGIDLRWLVRGAHDTPGAMALEALKSLDLPAGPRHAFAIGESTLATGARRHLVKTAGWRKDEVTFCGYWKYRSRTR